MKLLECFMRLGQHPPDSALHRLGNLPTETGLELLQAVSRLGQGRSLEHLPVLARQAAPEPLRGLCEGVPLQVDGAPSEQGNAPGCGASGPEGKRRTGSR